MIALPQHTECTGFEVIAGIPWSEYGANGGEWGFLVCTTPQDSRLLYGVVAPMHSGFIQQQAFGILLDSGLLGGDVFNLESALVTFALAYGLWITESAADAPAFGDALIVAGANPLAISILAAAHMTCIKTACVVANEDDGQRIARYADEIIPFALDANFDARVSAFQSRTHGKTAFVDTSGSPGLVSAMIGHLQRFESLTLCRQDIAAQARIDVYGDVHRKSTRIVYRSRPENEALALALHECYRRLVNLRRWKRLPESLSSDLLAHSQRLSQTDRFFVREGIAVTGVR